MNTFEIKMSNGDVYNITNNQILNEILELIKTDNFICINNEVYLNTNQIVSLKEL